MLRHSVVSDSVTPWGIVLQVPPSVGFSQQEYWSGLSYPPPRDLPDAGIKPASPAFPALADRIFFITSATWDAVMVDNI